MNTGFDFDIYYITNLDRPDFEFALDFQKDNSTNSEFQEYNYNIQAKISIVPKSKYGDSTNYKDDRSYFCFKARWDFLWGAYYLTELFPRRNKSS